MLYRRAQAARLICTDMVEKGEEIPNYFFLEEAVRDFCECFRLMNFDPKPMCEAIFVAVNFCKCICIMFSFQLFMDLCVYTIC